MIDKLNDIALVASKGIKLDNYFSYFNLLGPEWSGVIISLLASITFLLILFLIKNYSGVLLWFKNLIKWW